MSRLSHSDWAGLSEFIRSLYSETDGAQFPVAVLRGLRNLVPCEHAGYNEIDGRTSHVVFFCMHPWSQQIVDLTPALNPYMEKHPLLAFYRANPDRSALQTTDLMSQREFYQTGAYADFYRRAETSNQLAFPLTDYGSSGETGIAINRFRKEFSAREKALLDLARPHIIQAKNNLAKAASALLPGGAGRTGVVNVRDTGEIAHLDPVGQRLLEDYFPGSGRHPARLPEMLNRWLGSTRALLFSDYQAVSPPSFVILREESRLAVRFFMEHGGIVRLVLAEERVESPTRLAGAWNLTVREAEVLHWISEAKNNFEIAAILSISPRTVDKHVERVLSKLGVENRTAAARMAAGGNPGSIR